MDLRSKQIIEDWAMEAGYTLVSASPCYFGGAFFLRKTNNQTVYYVTIQDRKSRTRRGYVRCGGWLLGLMSNEVTVNWDKEA